MKRFFLKARDVLESKSGEGYVDTAVKMIIAVVIGALLLGGLYSPCSRQHLLFLSLCLHTNWRITPVR